MLYPTKTVVLRPADNDHVKRLKDPVEDGLYHMEAFLPFSEAIKLDRGNANVRPASERKKPFREMVATVEKEPSTFHLKNRGITYLCERFEFDNAKRTLTVRVPAPDAGPEDPSDVAPRFGIADGGHTFEVVSQTMTRVNELRELDGWREPFVRIHFIAGNGLGSGAVEVEQVVEALNTSSQVQVFTLDEYQNKFEALKKALAAGGFDISQIAFRENEDFEWDVREVVQRLACFLKDRWKSTQPASMYKSKGKALDLYTNDQSRGEFERLYDVAAVALTLPEFIESEFSRGEVIKGAKFGKVRAVRSLKKPYVRPGTGFQTYHSMDLAASLPLAAALRELLELKGDRYYWRLDPKEVFRRCAADLYKLLLAKVRSAKSVNQLGSDMEYWTQAAYIVLRTKGEMLAS